MPAEILKSINITEQINAYIQEQRFQQILGNKKADCIRQDNQSASQTKSINLITEEVNQHESV